MTDLHDLLARAYEALKDAHPYIDNDTVRNTVGSVIVDIEEVMAASVAVSSFDKQ